MNAHTHEQTPNRQQALTDHAPLHSLLYISVIKDKQGRLAPQLHGGGYPIGGSAGIHLPPTGHAAGEGNLSQARIRAAGNCRLEDCICQRQNWLSMKSHCLLSKTMFALIEFVIKGSCVVYVCG